MDDPNIRLLKLGARILKHNGFFSEDEDDYPVKVPKRILSMAEENNKIMRSWVIELNAIRETLKISKKEYVS